MKNNTLIFAVSMLLVGVLILSFCALRGDFADHSVVYDPLKTDLDNLVTEKDGRFLININRADVQTLTMLNGIGDVLGGRIVDYREENGEFESVEELIEVKGIGEKTLEKIRDRIVCLTEE